MKLTYCQSRTMEKFVIRIEFGANQNLELLARLATIRDFKNNCRLEKTSLFKISSAPLTTPFIKSFILTILTIALTAVYRISITCEIYFPMGAMSIFTVLLTIGHNPFIRFNFYISRTNFNPCMDFADSLHFHAIYSNYIFILKS